MKKLTKILCAFVLVFSLLFGFTSNKGLKANAASVTKAEFISTANSVLTDFSKFSGRFAGMHRTS